MNTDIAKIIRTIPKAELHIHIEGSLEPELIFALAKRNNISLPYPDVATLRAAYAFTNLQSFLDIYYAGASVLIHEQDFYDMTMAYLERAHADNVVHTEIFFDPQTHTERGVAIDVVINGLYRACLEAKAQWGINALLILCFLRHLSEQSAIETWNAARPFKNKLIGVGLDSSELGHPPEKFARVFTLCKAEGMRLVAHAGEEGPPAYIWQALDVLKVERIDHGVRCLEEADLVARLAKERMPLTVCPLSNLKLKVVSDMAQHPLKKMLDAGLCVTINSDDPAYFGGYMNTNWEATFAALDLTGADALTLASNSFEAAFVDEATRRGYLAQLTTHVAAHNPS